MTVQDNEQKWYVGGRAGGGGPGGGGRRNRESRFDGGYEQEGYGGGGRDDGGREERRYGNGRGYGGNGDRWQPPEGYEQGRYDGGSDGYERGGRSGLAGEERRYDGGSTSYDQGRYGGRDQVGGGREQGRYGGNAGYDGGGREQGRYGGNTGYDRGGREQQGRYGRSGDDRPAIIADGIAPRFTGPAGQRYVAPAGGGYNSNSYDDRGGGEDPRARRRERDARRMQTRNAPYARALECEASLEASKVAEIDDLVNKRLRKKLDRRFDEADDLLRQLEGPAYGVTVSDDARQWRADGLSFVYAYRRDGGDGGRSAAEVEEVEELLRKRGVAKSRKQFDESDGLLNEMRVLVQPNTLTPNPCPVSYL